MARTLELWVSVIVQIVSPLSFFCANASWWKNRAKRILYGILGLDRKNIQLLSPIELFVFAALSIGLGLILGVDFPMRHHLRFYWNSFNTISVLKIFFQFGNCCRSVNDGGHLRSSVLLNAAKIYMEPSGVNKREEKGEKKEAAALPFVPLSV